MGCVASHDAAQDERIVVHFDVGDSPKHATHSPVEDAEVILDMLQEKRSPRVGRIIPEPLVPKALTEMQRIAVQNKRARSVPTGEITPDERQEARDEHECWRRNPHTHLDSWMLDLQPADASDPSPDQEPLAQR